MSLHGSLRVAILVLASAILLEGNRTQAQQAIPNTSHTLYFQGDPTDDEQYLLQRLNRARMDPAGEGQRLAAWLRDTPAGQSVVSYYGTNPDQVASDFAVLPAVPPLAFDPDLIASARAHSTDLAPHDGLGPGGASNPLNNHLGYDGSTPDDRVKASGFRSAKGSDGYMGECFDPGSASLDEAHAGYLVDWGNPGLGHRRIEMAGSEDVNVVGIGLATKPASVDTAFPLVETEDYGGPGFVLDKIDTKLVNADVPAFLTGVVYRDANGNGQYDPGEGIAGVTVTMDGGRYYAVTSASGGYALPLVNAADGSNADGMAPVRMVFADAGVFTSTVPIPRYEGAYGSYRANVEWDATSADDQRTPDPGLPYFGGGKAATIRAGGVVKLKVFRPADSDLSQPYVVNYTVKGSAVAGENYAALPPTITVPAGERKVKVQVATLNSGGGNATTLKLKLPGVSYRGAKNVTITP